MNTALNTPSRLRIVHILPTLGVGGAENMAAHLMIGLAAQHNVTAVGLYPRSGSATEQRLKQAAIPIAHLGKRPGLDLRVPGALARLFRSLRPDVVHTHLSVLRYVYPVLLRHRVQLAVHTLHNTAERESDTVGLWVQRLAFWKTVVPVAISQDGAESFARVYSRPRPEVIANCIPVGDYAPSPANRTAWREQVGLPADATVFVCVGRLEPQKNPLGLLSAFAALDESCHLVLLGDGSLRSQVQAAIEAGSLSKRVHLMGKRNDIPSCLAGSDVFVLASDWEGSPLAVMEAMAAGLPVVSTAVGGVPELVTSGREGILVNAGDMRALTEAMRSLACDLSKRSTFAHAARKRAEAEFGAESMTRKYAALYAALLESRTGAARTRYTSAARHPYSVRAGSDWS